ncbi:MAG: hypothetical protein CYG61_09950 [Actinobacteria bacterium]|nr:MAG: hypothetical protein CYG61_09950 [Actinomycetota bacterium]
MSDLGPSGEGLVGRWDPDSRLFRATGMNYGPAGPATVEIGEGVRVSVDYANPHMTSEVVIEARLEGDPTQLASQVAQAGASLLGSEALARLLALGRSDPPHGPRRISGDEAPYRREPPLRRRSLGRLALLLELATEPDVTALQAAVAGLEGAAVAAIADPDMVVLAPLTRSLASRSAAALLGLNDAGMLAFEARRAALELAAVIHKALPFVDSELVRRRLRSLEDDLRARRLFDGDPPVAAVAAAPAVARAAREEARRRVAPGVPTDAAPDVAAVLRAATEIDVRVSDGQSGRWARVFRRRDLLLLATAPVERMGPAWRELLVVPAGHRPEELFVDVTDRPETARPSPTLASVRSAVATGREACRLERLGDTDAASMTWASCGDGWSTVGSPERAETARRYAAGDRTEFPARRRESHWRPEQTLAVDLFGR